jgi:hypothetical protein
MIQTSNFWRANSNGQTASILFHWDDATIPPRVVDLVYTNPTDKDIIWSLTSTSNGKVYSGVIESETLETTITLNNGNAQNRLEITVRPDGKLDGIEKSINFG